MCARVGASVNRRQENADARVDMREQPATRNALEERQMCALVMVFVFSQTSQSASVKVASLGPSAMQNAQKDKTLSHARVMEPAVQRAPVYATNSGLGLPAIHLNALTLATAMGPAMQIPSVIATMDMRERTAAPRAFPPLSSRRCAFNGQN